VRPRLVLTIAVPLACAAVFARLGVWQLARRAERRAFNTTLVTRLESAPVEALTLTIDTSLGHYRRVSAAGVYLYDREVTYAGRSRRGSPGVDLLTPLRLEGRDTVVLVNRGWVYSPDAKAVQLPRWREKDTAAVVGYAETYSAKADIKRAAAGVTATVTPRERTVRALDRAIIEQAVGLPVASYILVQTSDSALHVDSVPVRLPSPALDEGPHGSYAVQWFSFAAIAIAGGVLLFRAER
jgi:surfeit locus 1 family protein